METTQYIETTKKTDKNGHFYYVEKWVDVEYDGTINFKHTTVVSGRCSKEDFERRMSRNDLIDKSENFCMFRN